MDLRKLRVGKTARPGQQEVYVITIPPKIAMFFPNTYFNVQKSGNSILLISGTQFTEKQAEDLKLEDFKVE